MKRVIWILFIVLGICTLLAGCGGGAQNGASSTEGEEQGTSLDRPDTPAEFAGKTNPHATDAAAVTAGNEIFQTNCASCHGETGMGDGPASAALNPKPEPLATNEETLGDDYLFWRISKGGNFDPFNSVMPAWEGILNEEQIWQTVSFIRSLD